MNIAISKENLLKQADGRPARLTRRSRRLAETMTSEMDQPRLAGVTEELKESATRLEQEAMAASTGRCRCLERDGMMSAVVCVSQEVCAFGG